MHTTTPCPRDVLRERLDIVARFVRVAPTLTGALSAVLGFPLTRVPLEPDRSGTLDQYSAERLDARSGDPSIVRRGLLVNDLGSSGFRAAEVHAVVLPGSLLLTAEQRREFESGVVPLGTLLDDRVSRTTHYVLRKSESLSDSDVALRVQGTLVRAGRPVALVTEYVFWRTIRHRADAPVPPHVMNALHQAPPR